LKPEQGKQQSLVERRAAVSKTYQGTQGKSKQKFEVMGNGKLLVETPLPMVEVWEELQTIFFDNVFGFRRAVRAGNSASPADSEPHSFSSITMASRWRTCATSTSWKHVDDDELSLQWM
jgi:hypothetical protein